MTVAAFAGALLWGIHPLRVESVAWISERRDVLALVFFALAILFGLGARNQSRLAAAADYFGQALAERPDYLPALQAIVDVLGRLGRTAEAARWRASLERASTR